jgi:hypothetical protein
MAASGQGIDVGDAVLTFLGDTTQLDVAFDRVQAHAESSMGAAAGSVAQVGEATTELGAQLDATGENAEFAGDKIVDGMGKAKLATGEARGEAMLLGEAFGVHLPRHVTSFVAKLPGVGEALSAAFAATAVLFLLDALVKVTEKLSTWIGTTFIYTQAMKDADAATASANTRLMATAAAIDKAKQALLEYGMTASQKTQVAIDANSKSFASNATAIAANRAEVARLTQEQQASVSTTTTIVHGMAIHTQHVRDNSQAIVQLGSDYTELARKQTELTIEMKVLDLQLRDEEDAARKESLAHQGAFEEAKIAAAKTVGSAILAVQKAQADAAVAMDDATGVKRVLVAQAFAESDYQLDLATLAKKSAVAQSTENQIYQVERANLENRLAVQKTMGAEGVAAVAATEVQIEELAKSHSLKLRTEEAQSDAQLAAMQKQHSAASIENYADTMARLHTIVKAGVQLIASDLKDVIDPATQAMIKKIDDAAALLGVTLSSDLAKSAKDAQAALATLNLQYKDGEISLRDLQQAQVAAMNAQIAYDKQVGMSPIHLKAEQDAVDKLSKALDVELNKAALTEIRNEIAMAKAAGLNTAALRQQEVEIARSIKATDDSAKSHQGLQKVITQEDSAFNSLVQEMASGSLTIGQAAKKMAEQMISALVQYAEKKGAASLAQGFSDLGDPFTAPLATAAFEGAALWFALAGAASAAGGAVSGSGTGAAPTNPGQTTATLPGGQQVILQTGGTATTGSAGQTPVSATNAQHFASGGLVSKRTMAMVGDSPSGGDAEEGILPLSNPDAIDRIANALLSAPTLRAASAAMESQRAVSASSARPAAVPPAAARPQDDDAAAASSGGGNIHVHVKGLVSPDNLNKVIQQINKRVQKGTSNLNSSNTLRVTRRSL